MADAGWYPDPQNPQSQQFFDGYRWTGASRPAEPPHSAPQPQPTPQPQPAPQLPPHLQSQPQWQAPPQHPSWPPAWPGAAGPGAWQPPPSTPRRRKRAPLLIALVAVAAVVAGLVTWLLWPDDAAPSLTYKGKEIASPADVLTKAETNVAALVKKRHGASNDQTRCYFAQPENPQSGAKKTDIEDALRCGPVLFVDGEPASSYFSVPLTSTDSSGSKVTLDPQQSLDGLTPAALEPTLKLVRPDGKSAPEGTGGLTVPEPPAAAKDVLTVATLDSSGAPPAVGNAAMIGRNTKVTLDAAGEITRYGKGDDARSAPAGQKLLAFQASYGSGEVSGAGTARARVVVDGAPPRPVPEASGGEDEYVVIAVPTGSEVVLQLTDAGFTQTLSLPDGKAGSKNIAVLARKHRTAFLDKSFSVPIHLSTANGSTDVTFQASAKFASLDFWIPRHTTKHPNSPENAILSVPLTYTDSSAPGQSYGFDPQLLRLKLPGGRVVRARNVASGNRINDVFEVPADYTSGTLEITGSEKVGRVTVRVSQTKSFVVTIPSG